MAFELVTGHAATAHITAEQVSRFIQGITVMDDTTVYRLNNGNDAALSISTLTVTIATGETILHGFHSTNEEALQIPLDPTTTAGNSRIDKIVMEVLQDDTTGVQYTSILTVQGEESTTPTAPDTPSSSGSDTITLLAVGLIATVTVTDSVISAWTDNTNLYAGSFLTQEEYEEDLGSADISEIGDGTLTGAISENAENISTNAGNISTNAENISTNTGNISTNTANITKAFKEVPWYATCSTAASTTAKVATCNQSGFSLVTGAKVIVKFDYTNTAAAPTLNVNSTGAIDIVAYGTTAPDLFWVAGDVVEFTYNGTSWVMHPTQGQISELNTNLTALNSNISTLNIYVATNVEITFSNTDEGLITISALTNNVVNASNIIGAYVTGIGIVLSCGLSSPKTQIYIKYSSAITGTYYCNIVFFYT